CHVQNSKMYFLDRIKLSIKAIDFHTGYGMNDSNPILIDYGDSRNRRIIFRQRRTARINRIRSD
ncbi:MAG: hypothetical protein ACM3YE_16735, partial [Bacteroidota bacterium]